jgi:MFS family permease
LDIFVFSIVSVFYIIIAGCFFDNIGRKNTIVIGIFVLSFFLISSSGFVGSEIIIGMPKRIFLSIIYAFSILPLLISVFIMSGDFSTERGNLKYRGRIIALYMAIMFLGVMIGFMLYKVIDGLYTTVPELEEIIPGFPDHLHIYMLVILLVWLTTMKESLFSKEANWASTIKKLYVFSKPGICVYYHDFDIKNEPEKKMNTEWMKTSFQVDFRGF